MIDLPALPTSSVALDVRDPFQYNTSSIRIQTISTISQIVFACVCTAAITAAVCLTATGCVVPAMATVATVSAVALAMFLALKGLMRIRSTLPRPLNDLVLAVHTIVLELIHVIPTGILTLVPLSRFEPKSKESCISRHPPILLIHGILAKEGTLAYPFYRLSKNFSVFAINHGGPFQSIDDCADTVREKIEQIRAITGSSTVTLIGHSMGGLVAIRYRQKHADAQGIRVSDIATLGTPLNGTTTASLGAWASQEAAEMKIGSEFLQNMQKSCSTDDATKYLHIGSFNDTIIRPVASTVDGHGKHTQSIQLEGMPHMGYVLSDLVGDILEQYLLQQ
jgi:triacylglycerol esterase/lipase EstA (alpha/beta hydrolase family)